MSAPSAKIDRKLRRRLWLQRRKRLDAMARKAAEAENWPAGRDLAAEGAKTPPGPYLDVPDSAIAAEDASRAFKREPPRPEPRFSSGVSSVYDGPSDALHDA